MQCEDGRKAKRTDDEHVDGGGGSARLARAVRGRHQELVALLRLAVEPDNDASTTQYCIILDPQQW